MTILCLICLIFVAFVVIAISGAIDLGFFIVDLGFQIATVIAAIALAIYGFVRLVIR